MKVSFTDLEVRKKYPWWSFARFRRQSNNAAKMRDFAEQTTLLQGSRTENSVNLPEAIVNKSIAQKKGFASPSKEILLHKMTSTLESSKVTAIMGPSG